MRPQQKPNLELPREPRLLAAALAGLLSLTACSTSDSTPSNSGKVTATGGAASTGGAPSTGGDTSTAGAASSGGASTGGEPSSGGAATGGANASGGAGGDTSSAGAAGAGGDTSTPEITSSIKVENLDAEGFKALCDERGGTVEVMAHCGGLATARGFAYDTTNSMLSEHTCKGANTCAGWNCVTDE